MLDRLEHAKALVIDANTNARMLVVSHLKELGVGTVRAVTKTRDARLALEAMAFDIVVSDNDFGNAQDSGQQLLDELRREQILPPSTVFVMVTTDRSYAAVAGAAEAALDVYLIKPYTFDAFAERLQSARRRKQVLKPVFDAMAAGQHEEAARLCLARFQAREDCWLHAARIGAELLLRLQRASEARALYTAIIEAKTVPWAKLGVACAEYAAGRAQNAKQSLQTLVGEMPKYADGWDVLGRVHLEEGQLEQALATYQQAMALTPTCLLRAQRAGTLAFYVGQRDEALRLLGWAAESGLDSRLFDYYSLVLLAFLHFDAGLREPLQQVLARFEGWQAQQAQSARVQRLHLAVRALVAGLAGQGAEAQADAARLAQALDLPDADLEAACLFIAVRQRLLRVGLRLPDDDACLHRLALRYCVNKASTEVLVAMAEADEPAVALVRRAHEEVFRIAEQALTLSLKHQPTEAVRLLAERGQATRNAKLIDMAGSVLERHAKRIDGPEALAAQVQALQEAWVWPINGARGRAVAGQPVTVPQTTRGPSLAPPEAADQPAG